MNIQELCILTLAIRIRFSGNLDHQGSLRFHQECKHIFFELSSLCRVSHVRIETESGTKDTLGSLSKQLWAVEKNRPRPLQPASDRLFHLCDPEMHGCPQPLPSPPGPLHSWDDRGRGRNQAEKLAVLQAGR